MSSAERETAELDKPSTMPQHASMGETAIEWTRGDDGTPGRTWNPVRGCSRVSEGCRFCYAELIAARFSKPGMAYEGLARFIRPGEPRWTGKGLFVKSKLTEPLSWQKPSRVFVNSQSDLFFEEFSNEQIAAIFGVMALAGKHTFQVLTKRPERMSQWFKWISSIKTYAGSPVDTADVCIFTAIDMFGVKPPKGQLPDIKWPLPNVWLGVSVEDQKAADYRIPILIKTPAAIKFLSCEPLLGPVDLDMGRCDIHNRAAVQTSEDGEYCNECAASGYSGELSYGHWLGDPDNGISWIIIGAESGSRRRDMDLSWAQDLYDCGRRNGIAIFVKQDSALRSGERGRLSDELWAAKEFPTRSE